MIVLKPANCEIAAIMAGRFPPPEEAPQGPSRRMGRRRADRKRVMSEASVYIVLCSDRSYYTGITRREVEERLGEHNQGMIATAILSRGDPFA